MLEDAIKKLAEEWIEEDEMAGTVTHSQCDHLMPNRHDDKHHCFTRKHKVVDPNHIVIHCPDFKEDSEHKLKRYMARIEKAMDIVGNMVRGQI